MNPSLALIPCAFDTGKLYSVLPDNGLGDLTVSRNGTGTYMGADGLLKTAQPNEPRLEFNTDGTFKGVLVEPAATNALLRSEEFENVYWAKTAISVFQNQVMSPNGLVTADRILNQSTGFSRLTSPPFTFLANTDYTVSVFVKNIDALRFSIVLLENTVNNCWFNLEDYSVISTNGVMSNGNILNIGKGWYKISVKIRYTLETLSAIYFRISATTNVNTADPDKSVYLWGAQLEVGSVATSYIPTVESTVTRPADVITRTNAQDLIGQTEGTVFVEVTPISNSDIFRIMGDTNSFANGFFIYITSGNSVRVTLRASGTDIFTATVITPASPKYKLAVSYSSGNSIFCLNGVLGSTLLQTFSFSVPLTRILIDSANWFGSNQNKNISNVTLFKTRLSNAQLQALTTL